MPKRGILRLCFEKLLSHSTEEKLLKPSGVSKKLFKEEVSRFSVENFCLTGRKNFVDEPFWLSESGIQKFHGKEGERLSHFSVKNFWSKCQKNSYGNPLVSHYFRVSKNFMLKKVMSRFSVELFMSHRTEELRRGTLLCFRKNLV